MTKNIYCLCDEKECQLSNISKSFFGFLFYTFFVPCEIFSDYFVFLTNFNLSFAKKKSDKKYLIGDPGKQNVVEE